MSGDPHIEGFELLDVIGRGGMGTVYRARNLKQDRIVALKVIHGHLSHDSTFRTRFESEMKVTLKLDHPNLVPVLDVGESDDNLYIAFALIKGQDLKSYLNAHGPFSPDRAVVVLKQVASALDYVHESGFIHRDVKPSNIMRDSRTGHIYLSDFGIARAKDASSALTGSAAIGAIEYMAPEQFENIELDERVDVYASGCLVYELLTADTPFDGESHASILRAKLGPEPPSLDALGSDAGPELKAVIAVALNRDRVKRYPSVLKFSQAVEDAMDGSGPTRLMAVQGNTDSKSSDPTISMARNSRKDVLPQKQQKNPWLKPMIVGAAAVTLLVGAGLVASVVTSGNGGDTQPAVSASVSPEEGDSNEIAGEPSKQQQAIFDELEAAREQGARDAVQRQRIRQLERQLEAQTSPSARTYVSQGDDWPGGSAYTAILASLESEAEAVTFQKGAKSAGLDAGILLSSDYSSLNPGYWVVFSGTFDSSDGAAARADHARSLGYSSTYPRFVSP